MVYGLRIFDASGNVTLNVTDYVARLVYTKTVARNSTGSEYISIVANKKAITIAAPTSNNSSGFAIICELSSAGYLSWHPMYLYDVTSNWYNPDVIIVSGESLIYVFLLE